MKNFSFSVPQDIIVGAGSIKKLGECATKLGGTHALIISGPHLNKMGLVDTCKQSLADVGIPADAFTETEGNPSVETVEKATKLYKECGADFIVAFGGGSPMDVAKAVGVIAKYGGSITEYEGGGKVPGPIVPQIAIPTTAGTGSEVTPFAVITDEKTGTKYPLADYQLMPNMAIVDTDMMMSAPRGLTSASGIDALTHALEAYASVMATDYTDGLALRAMKLIFKYLPGAYDNGQTDVKAREEMATASTMAGMAFANAFLGVCHSMAHKLGAYHHLPHGIANALLITMVMRYNADPTPRKMGTFSQYQYPHTLERYCECAHSLGIVGKNDEDTLNKFIDAIEALKERVGIKKTIADYGVDEKHFLDTLDNMVEDAFDDQCTGANPRYPLMSELKEMYLKAYYGK